MRPSASELLGIEPETALPVVDAATLADVLGCTASTVRRLAADGVIQRAGPNAFDLRTAVRRYVSHKTAAKPGASDRARRERAQADLMEAKSATIRAELVPVVEVERAWQAIVRDIRAGMMAIPSRVRSRLPTLTAGDSIIIESEIRAVLTSLAGGDDGNAG